MTLQSTGLIPIVLAGCLVSCSSGRCLDLPPCEQYTCMNPDFYCARELYASGIEPRDIATAQRIVQEYLDATGKSGTPGLSVRSPEPHYWFNVDINFDDGTSRGYVVGPDGGIYEMKRRN